MTTRVVLCAGLLLLAASRARALCSAVDTGLLQGTRAVHLETLRPGQRDLRLTVPPVCMEQSGMRVTACETAPVSSPGAASDAAPEGEAPQLAVAGRHVAVTRSADAEGFAVLSVQIYCVT